MSDEQHRTAGSDALPLSRTARAEGSPEIEQRIRRYRPRMSALAWDPVAGFVQDAVLLARPATIGKATRLLPAVAAFAVWMQHHRGISPDLDSLNPAMIEAFSDHRARTHSVSQVVADRRFLHEVGEHVRRVLRSDPILPRPERASPTRPYDDADLARIENWATTLSTARRRHNAKAIIGLALGCGVRQSELRSIRRRHITDHGAHGIEVLLPDRTVWSDASWEDWLRDAAERVTGDDYLFLYDDEERRRADAVSQYLHFSRESPSVSRLRTTWVVTLMRRHVPNDVVVQAAGLRTLGSLHRYLQYVPRTPVQQAPGLLRGASR